MNFSSHSRRAAHTNSTRSRSRSNSPRERQLPRSGRIAKGGLIFTGSVGATLPRKKGPETPKVLKKEEKTDEFKVP